MKKIIRLTESDLTRIVRRVIMEQEGDNEISQALDNLNNQLKSMMKNVLGKYPQLERRGIGAEAFLDQWINEAKSMKLKQGGEKGELIAKDLINLLTVQKTAGYQYNKIKKIDDVFYRLSNGLNENYNERNKASIIKLIDGLTQELKSAMMLK
jgi:hypothetical protein